MSPRFLLERENVPRVAEVVNRLLKAECTDFTDQFLLSLMGGMTQDNGEESGFPLKDVG